MYVQTCSAGKSVIFLAVGFGFVIYRTGPERLQIKDLQLQNKVSQLSVRFHKNGRSNEYGKRKNTGRG